MNIMSWNNQFMKERIYLIVAPDLQILVTLLNSPRNPYESKLKVENTKHKMYFFSLNIVFNSIFLNFKF